MALPEVSYTRRPTRPVRVGDVIIGGNHPVVVQSMITEETHNVSAAVEQIIAMHKAGSEIVRVTTPNLAEARCLAEIKAQLRKRYQDVPLVADVHHQGTEIAVEVAKYVDKVRINPGLFVFRKRVQRTVEYSQAEIEEELEAIEQALLPVIEACKARDIAMRIGVNHGSLAERLMVMYGDTPEGMVESAIEYLQICERHDFRNLVISLKASRVPVMLQANRLMARRMAELGMDYPLHLGVTEAGDGQYARIKSTTGIGTLLAEGIGDTIRVSLSEDPIEELSACYDILQALGLRRTKVEFIACPSCGRTKFDLPTVNAQIKAATAHLGGNISIAVMGCIVNGPGEMADADYGYVGKAGGKISLYRGRQEVKSNVPQERGVEELIALIKADGRWVDPPEGYQPPEPPQSFNERIKVNIPLISK
ncbi:MAG TPA: (E)-4-hydroxy-3-methylbut-2-enyl-diphosphate synthase [Chthonomonadaceae bacterium]|nr:(E)-4-hydroxy-3-methylbut-2-enyl-diphosphate synthase [Chthonomonadaceae bacterium]